MQQSVTSLSTPAGWQEALKNLADHRINNNHTHTDHQQRPIPAFFFAHGHPGIVYDMGRSSQVGQGVDGDLNRFLKDFGPSLLKIYKPKAILVFSAHWETQNEILVTDYGEDQPLLYDYYGFPDHFYKAEWHSNGSKELSEKVIKKLQEFGISGRLTTRKEARGEDGIKGPSSGLDHGVFIPFMLMFPEGIKKTFPIPIVQVSIDGTLDPIRNMKLGKSVSELRKEGILILAGGLTIHTFQDWNEWKKETASESVKEFESAILQASLKENTNERLKSLINLKNLKGFKKANPRAEHFVPIWIAAGAGSDQGSSQIVTDLHGCKTIAFGVTQ